LWFGFRSLLSFERIDSIAILGRCPNSGSDGIFNGDRASEAVCGLLYS
jgi:hypothetical protein